MFVCYSACAVRHAARGGGDVRAGGSAHGRDDHRARQGPGRSRCRCLSGRDFPLCCAACCRSIKRGRFLIGDAPPQTAPSTARRSTRPRLWAEIGTEEWSDVDLERAVALLPIGAIEQHGPHLPCGVDTYQLEGVIASALGRLEEEQGSAQVLTLPVSRTSQHSVA